MLIHKHMEKRLTGYFNKKCRITLWQEKMKTLILI